MRRTWVKKRNAQGAMVLLAALLVLVLLATVVAQIGYTGALLANSARAKARRTALRLGLESGMATLRQAIPTQPGAPAATGVSAPAPAVAFTVGNCMVEAVACPAATVTVEASTEGEPTLLTDFRKLVSLTGWQSYLQDCKLNVNTASLALLKGRLVDLGNAIPSALVERRKAKPFQKLEELKEVPGVTEEVYTRLVKDLDVVDRDFLLLCRSAQEERAGWMAAILHVEENSSQFAAATVLDE